MVKYIDWGWPQSLIKGDLEGENEGEGINAGEGVGEGEGEDEVWVEMWLKNEVGVLLVIFSKGNGLRDWGLERRAGLYKDVCGCAKNRG